MEKYQVKGGNRLSGTIKVSGAKNAALPILAATLITEGRSVIHDVPKLTDVRVMKDVVEALGATMDCQGNTVIVDAARVLPGEVSVDIMRKMRASNLVMGPMLSRFGKFTCCKPGGCAIGSRPMDQHLKGFQALGAQITEQNGFIHATAHELRGGNIHLDFPSVGATENIMMAAVYAKGTTIISNAAKEPEIADLQNFLNALGADITGAGSDIIKIQGVRNLGSAEHVVIPDRIEAGTHMVTAAITQGDITITNIIPEHVDAITAKLKEAGAIITIEDNSIRVQGPETLKAIDIKTLTYPGFPTDMQAQMMVLCTVAKGTSIISESIFENRFMHVDELRRMGAHIAIEGRAAIIKGVPLLTGATVEATDLRAGAALTLAGLIAEGTTIIENIDHIQRGYEDLDKKYQAIGADIIKFKE